MLFGEEKLKTIIGPVCWDPTVKGPEMRTVVDMVSD
jgi:hypothetical protein